MDKKGELTSKQIIGIVLVVAGIIIGVGFFIVFSEERPDKELCRLSVVERASAPVGKDVVPLKCTTEKVCITTDEKEKCKEFTGEENIRYVELDIPTENTDSAAAKRKVAVEKIEQETANAMFDCWRMTGEGKLDIFGNEGGVLGSAAEKAVGELALQDVLPKCIVCSRIAISDSIKQKDKEIRENLGKSLPLDIQASPSEDELFLDNVDVNDYLVRNKVPGSSLTYLQTFTDENVGGYAEFSAFESEKAEDLIGEKKPAKNVSQLAMVFVQIKVPNVDASDSYWKAFATGGVVGAGAALTGPGGLVTRAAGPVGLLVEATGIAVGSHMYATEVENTVKENQLMAATTCGEYNTNYEKAEKQGCSLVKAISWDPNEINKLCRGGIESNF